MAFKLAIEFATRGSACAFPVLGISRDIAMKKPAARIPITELFLFMSRTPPCEKAGVLATPRMISVVELAPVHMANRKFKRLFHLRALHRGGAGGVSQPCETPDEITHAFGLRRLSHSVGKSDEKAATTRIRNWMTCGIPLPESPTG
jgi:hypothetical protein